MDWDESSSFHQSSPFFKTFKMMCCLMGLYIWNFKAIFIIASSLLQLRSIVDIDFDIFAPSADSSSIHHVERFITERRAQVVHVKFFYSFCYNSVDCHSLVTLLPYFDTRIQILSRVEDRILWKYCLSVSCGLLRAEIKAPGMKWLEKACDLFPFYSFSDKGPPGDAA